MLKSISVRVFNVHIKLLWMILAAVTVVSETIPTPHVGPWFFYGLYGPSKLLCFLALGFLTPLAFALLGNLNRAIVFALSSAIVMEALQLLIGNGHRFHWYELFAKLLVIFFGFAFGLDARSDHEFILGPVRIALFSK